MQLSSAFLHISAAASVPASIPGGKSAWANTLPEFSREFPVTDAEEGFPPLDAAVAFRFAPNGSSTTFLLEGFPEPFLNSSALYFDDGERARFGEIHLLAIRVGKKNPDAESTGAVTVTITDCFGSHSVSSPDIDLVLGSTFAPDEPDTATEISILFGLSTNLVAEVLIVGRQPVPPEEP